MHSKRQPIAGLKEGGRVEDVFVVKIKKGISPYTSGYSFHLLLTDATGRTVDYKYWGDNNQEKIRQIYDSIISDSVVFIQGRVSSFQRKLQISTNPPDSIKPLTDGEYDPNDFILPPRRNIEDMVKELYTYIDSVQSPEIKGLLEKLFIQDKEFIEKFKRHPGAIEIHHNWIGGLLQHTLEMAKYCELSKKLYKDLDWDLMLAGVLLHDVGKLEEIAVTSRIKGTKKGQLKGHIAMAYRKVANMMDELKTSEAIRDKILHIILSHQGEPEFGSPKQPMFSEAVAVHYADQFSSKLTEMIEFIKEHKGQTEDEFMWNRRHRRNILLR